MKTPTLFATALVCLSQLANVSAAVNPTKVVERSPDLTHRQPGIQSPSTFPKIGGPTSQGCFSSSGNMTFQSTPEYMSSGACETVCKGKNLPVMALQGNQCSCGSLYPPKDTLSKDSNCDYPCPYYPDEACGGLGNPGYWSIFNTGIELNVDFEPDEKDKDKTDSSSTSSSSTTQQTSTSAPPTEATVTQTQDPNNDSDEDKKSGPNTAGIAAGVVVGVAVIAGGIGGFFFWMRRRRNAEIEEDHRRNAAVNAFISGSKPPSSHGSISMTDSRLDPVMAHRRMSDGSIADNEDYSRRILRVTNA